MQEKIDVVYTWVNGEDPIWRQKRQKEFNKIKNTSEIALHGNVEGRYRDNEELRYSLRSLEKYFPEHGNIYIVTDNQIPDFLKENSQIKIIFHKEIIDTELLPIFSSKHIETALINITNLSERFLYFNDDIFLGPGFKIEDMFLGYKSIQYFIKFDTEFVHSRIPSSASSHDILKSSYNNYILTEGFPAHVPKAIHKSFFIKMKQEFLSLFQGIESEKFRSILYPSLLSDFYVRWMLHHGYSSLGTKQDFYIQSSTPRYTELIKNFEKIPFFVSMILEMIYKKMIGVFGGFLKCLKNSFLNHQVLRNFSFD